MTTMWRLTSRSIRRAITKEELWNGNTEEWSNFFSTNADRNIFLWTWQRYGSTVDRYEKAMSESASDSFEWIHLRSQKEINDFVEGLSSGE